MLLLFAIPAVVLAEGIVKVIYVVPRDRTIQQDIPAKISTQIKKVQTTQLKYTRSQMEAIRTMTETIDWARLIFKDWDKYYPLYIQSEEWKEKRIEVLRRDGYMCVCGSRAEVVHHNNYQQVGNENLFELVALCEECHSDVHAKIKDWRTW